MIMLPFPVPDDDASDTLEYDQVITETDGPNGATEAWLIVNVTEIEGANGKYATASAARTTIKIRVIAEDGPVCLGITNAVNYVYPFVINA
jgi:hypothetical protein